MSALESVSTALRARAAVLTELTEAGLPATSDAGAFYPTGILVGLPTLVSRTIGAASYSVPVSVVSGDPVNDLQTVAKLYALADETALVLRCDTYRPGSWGGGINSEPLTAIEMECLVTIQYFAEEVKRNATDG